MRTSPSSPTSGLTFVNVEELVRLDLNPHIEAQLAAYARREGIESVALVEKMVRQYHPLPASLGGNELGGKTLGELYGHLLGTVSFEPEDLAERDEEYLGKSGFGGDSVS